MPEEKQIQLNSQQAIALFQSERAKLETLEQNYVQLRVGMDDAVKAKETIQAMKKTGSKEEILIPLGAGVFAFATLTDTKNVQVSLGGGVVSKNTMDEALQKLENRMKETEQQLQVLQRELEQTASNVENLSRALQSGAPRPAPPANTSTETTPMTS